MTEHFRAALRALHRRRDEGAPREELVVTLTALAAMPGTEVVRRDLDVFRADLGRAARSCKIFGIRVAGGDTPCAEALIRASKGESP
jgi:hypothetical protein